MTRPVVMLAFYKGRTRFLDRLIQWWTASQFSHVELFAVHDTPEEARDRATMFNRGDGIMALTPVCLSASWRDGGVRSKPIDLDPAHWRLVAVPWADADQPWEVCGEHWGKPYDWPGLIRTQVLRLKAGPAWKRRWFCSEIVAHALGLPDPWQFSPGGLFERVSEMNTCHAKLTTIKSANLRRVPQPEPEAFQ